MRGWFGKRATYSNLLPTQIIDNVQRSQLQGSAAESVHESAVRGDFRGHGLYRSLVLDVAARVLAL